ncbi:sec-independent translocase -like [Chlorella sorokiniana]|uniref:Sec-independent translocase-like n=1 Tax=Chlorella sorokiniana TaxID=3076 RepID=A0A2P6TCI6_CHLSO|nr:sec-independent translocase -like [Chlorella sorokiniana]|eukprot:PRW20348.1 sec-independent translocase -like [Chlorella sorokiniana]
MFSLGEVVVLCVAAAWIFGPNELPRVARHAGRLTGQATGFLYRARARFFKFAEEAEVTKLHEEMQATMYQLNAIRAELQGGINFLNPGPMAQRVLSIKPVPGQDGSSSSASFPAAHQQQVQQQVSQAPQAAAPAPAWAPDAAAVQQQQLLQRPQQQQAAAGLGASFAASALQAAAAPAAAAAGSASANTAAAQPLLQQQQQRVQAQEGEQDQHPMMLPVSAVAAGWAPDRAGKAPSGSEIFLDALAEELVAAHVLRFQQQQMQQQALMQQRAAAAAGAEQQQQRQQQQPADTAAAQQPGQPAAEKDA